MKNRNNKILAAIVCSAIATSMGLSIFGDFNKDEAKASLNDKRESSDLAKEENKNDEELEDESKDNKLEAIEETVDEIAKADEEYKNFNNAVIENNERITNSNISSSDNNQSNPNSNNNSENNSSNQGNDTPPSVVPPVVEEGGSDEVNNGDNSLGADEDISDNTPQYVDGVYFGSAKGYEKGLEVSVEVSNGVIVRVSVINHNDMPAFADRAIEIMPSRIVEAQSTTVDTVSGSTLTSRGIMKAVNNALSNA